MARQKRMNAFTSKKLKGVGVLRVDGVDGPATRKRIRDCKYWLGWSGKNLTREWSAKLSWHLQNPLRRGSGANKVSLATVRRGITRRFQHNRHYRKSFNEPGVTLYDGVHVAKWLVPYLQYARSHGWRGRLVSGWRDPAYSEKLCYNMCGAPRCPGLCAGRSSNHSGSVKPHGALDVSYYYDFGRIIRGCTYTPHLTNHLPRDPVHWSASGY